MKRFTKLKKTDIFLEGNNFSIVRNTKKIREMLLQSIKYRNSVHVDILQFCCFLDI